MARFIDRITCPLCAHHAAPERLGIGAELPEHDLGVVRQHFLGRSDIRTERLALPHEWLAELRGGVASVLARLDAELEAHGR